MAEYVTPVNQFLKSIDPQPYERYLPNAFNDSLSLLEKVNKVIYELNETNKVSGEVIEKWNDFVELANSGKLVDNQKIIEMVDNQLMPDFKSQIIQSTNEKMEDITNIVTDNVEHHADNFGMTTPSQGMFTITLDDGRIEDYSTVLPEFQKRGIKATTYITVNLLGKNANYMVPEHVRSLYKAGWEIGSHIMDHNSLSSMTPQEQEYQLSESKKRLESMIGDRVRSVAFPYGVPGVDFNRDTINLSRKYYTNAVTVEQKHNTTPIKQFEIARFSIKGAELPYLKTLIDKAIQDKTWFIIYFHGQDIEGDLQPVFQKILDLIDYGIQKGIKIVTMEEGLKSKGNLLETVEGEKRTAISKEEGKFSTSYIDDLMKKPKNNIELTTPITDFEKGKITPYSFLEKDGKTGFPEQQAGTLITYRLGETDYTSFQIWYPFSNDKVMYKRRWDSYNNRGWQPFEKFDNSKALDYLPVTSVTSETPLTSFTKGKISATAFQVSDNKTGFPEIQAGTLVTYRISDNDYIGFQLWYPYNSGTFYKREWHAVNKVWNAWNIHSTSYRKTIMVDSGYIGASSFVDTTVECAEARVNSVIQATPKQGIIGVNNCNWNAWCPANGQITIRVQNFSTTGFTLGQKEWNVIITP